MKSIVKIVLDKNIKEPKYSLTISSFPEYDLEFAIYTDGNKDLYELLNNEKAINEKILYILEHGDNLKNKDISKLTDIDALLSSIDMYSFDASKAQWSDSYESLGYVDGDEYTEEEKEQIIFEYMSKEESFKTKRILLSTVVDLDTDVNALIEKYKDYSNLYVLSSTSYEPIPFEVVKKNNRLNEFIDELKSMKLSPLEYAILVYDIVREKPYKQEKKKKPSSSSRETYSALSGEDIVCLGYANIYSTILKKLGIPCSIVTLKGIKHNEEGHARNVVRINDSKYDVNGIYFTDPTMDYRHKYDLKRWLYSYRGFMKKKSYYSKIDQEHKQADSSFGYLDRFKTIDMDKLFELYNSNPIQVVIKGGKLQKNYFAARQFVRNMLELYEPIDDKTDNETAMNIYKKYADSIEQELDNPLYISSFLRALIKVRFIEHKISPLRYDYNLDLILSHVPNYGFEIDDSLRKSNNEEDISREPEANEEDIIIHNIARIVAEECNNLKSKEAIGEIKVIKSIKLYNKKDGIKFKLWK